MRWLLLSFVLGILSGCELGMTARDSVDRQLLTRSGWEVQESSNASLLPEGTLMAFSADRRFTSTQFRCRQWRSEEEVVFITDRLGNLDRWVRVERLSLDTLKARMQPFRGRPQVQIVATPGRRPQERFTKRALKLPEESANDDQGENSIGWHTSPRYNCKIHFGGLWPNPTAGDTVHLPYLLLRGYRRPPTFHPGDLTLKGVDDTGRLVTLDSTDHPHMFTFDPASLAASGNDQDARGIRRLVVVNHLRQVIGYGNLVVE